MCVCVCVCVLTCILFVFQISELDPDRVCLCVYVCVCTCIQYQNCNGIRCTYVCMCRESLFMSLFQTPALQNAMHRVLTTSEAQCSLHTNIPKFIELSSVLGHIVFIGFAVRVYFYNTITFIVRLHVYVCSPE